MINIERIDNVLKQIRNEYEKAIECENKAERDEVDSYLLPQALVIAEALIEELKEMVSK